MSTGTRALANALLAIIVVFAGLLCFAGPVQAEGGSLGVNAGWWTHGPWGGQVNSLAMDAEETLYAATDDSGIFRSHDGGQSWAASSSGLSSLSVTQLALGGASLFAVAGGRLFVSTDQAGSWSLVATPLDMVVEQLAVSPSFAADHNLYIGGYRVERESGLRHALLYRSQDSGEAWAPLWDEMESDGITYELLTLAISPAHGRDGRLWIVQQEIAQDGPHYDVRFSLHRSTNRGRT